MAALALTSANLPAPLDQTHDSSLTSWVEAANDAGTDFPLQNLPLGVFSEGEGEDAERHIGVAIGDSVLDVTKLVRDGVVFNRESDLDRSLAAALQRGDGLNDVMALGADARRRLRQTVHGVLAHDAGELQRQVMSRGALFLASRVWMHLPARIGHYIDCYTSPHHAAHVAAIFRPNDPPLMPNFLKQPIAYNGDPRSVVMSGQAVRRPWGQQWETPGGPGTVYAPERMLDYEAELGILLGGQTALNDGRVRMADVWEYFFGMNIVNDWSARGIQAFEYQPLGPWNGKSFATSISPWVVMSDALLPYLQPKPTPDSRFVADATLEYLAPLHDYALDVTIEVYILSDQMRREGRAPHRISSSTSLHLAWDVAQMIVQHNGIINPGDLIATGTISGEEDDTLGCLLERRQQGRQKVVLPTGEERASLADGDEVIMRAYIQRPGLRRIGFGEVRGVVLPARVP